jgi:phosphoglycerate dehydrogenase-like enzyme
VTTHRASAGSRPVHPRVLILAGRRLFASFFGAAERARLRRFRWEVAGGRRLTAALRRRLARADALVTTWDSPPLGEALLAACPRLKLIAHCGGEVKSRFAAPLFGRLTITNAADPMARHVAELAAAFLLHEARNIDAYRAAIRCPGTNVFESRHLRGVEGETLLGATVGLVGFGRIGRALVELLTPFGTRFVVFDPYAGRRVPRGARVRFAPLEEVLGASRLLVLAAALTAETRNLLDRRRLSRLAAGTSIVNVARGGLVDLEALTSEVVSGRLRCALDVTDPVEPLPGDHPLRTSPHAILTPHVGAGADSVRRAMAGVVLDELERHFDGRHVRHRVTPAMLERMT